MPLGAPAPCPGVKDLDGPVAPAAGSNSGTAGEVKERGGPRAAARRSTTLPISDTPPVSSRVQHILFAEPTCAPNRESASPTENSTSFLSIPIRPSNAPLSSQTFESPPACAVPQTESRSSPGRSAGGGEGRGVTPHTPRRGTPPTWPDPRRSGALYSPAPDGGRCACAASGAGCWV